MTLVKEDLETRAENLLKRINQDEKLFNYSVEEIDFLLSKEYVVIKKGTLEYWITSKGREYALK